MAFTGSIMNYSKQVTWWLLYHDAFAFVVFQFSIHLYFHRLSGKKHLFLLEFQNDRNDHGAQQMRVGVLCVITVVSLSDRIDAPFE